MNLDNFLKFLVTILMISMTFALSCLGVMIIKTCF